MQESNVNTGNVNNKKNNTLLYVIIVILVIAVLGLGGFIIYDKTNNKTEPNSNEQSNNLETSNKEEQTSNSNTLVDKLDNSKDWVYDAVYEKKVNAESYKTYADNTYYAKDIVVPYININSEYANQANTSIKKVFDDAIKTYNSGIKDKMTYIKDCNYKKYSNGNTLSVILTYGVGATDVVHPNYYVYNFDLKTGDKLTYEEVYTISGFTADNIESKVTTAITNQMKKELEDYPDEYKSDKEFNKYNTASINNYKKSVTNGKLRYFLADNNKLNVIVTLSIPAGTGEFDTIITVE